MEMTLERLLPRLVSAYDQGILVPFLGAGMSRQFCPDWATLIRELETATSLRPTDGEASDARDNDPTALIRRANAAVRQLSLEVPPRLAESLKASLYGNATHRSRPEAEAPAQSTALAQLWWPLVVTSNYDDLFAMAYERRRNSELRASLVASGAATNENQPDSAAPYGGHLRILGRSRADCEQVLSTLSITAQSALWAIHGFLPRTTHPALTPLARELVVGHDEYRRVAHADPAYRRTFGEVWRRRSLLFLGSSLGDPYLLDLFSEIQEVYGTNPQPHYALIGPEDKVDELLLRTRFNIIVTRLRAYEELPTKLAELKAAVHEHEKRQRSWSWRYRSTESPEASADLTIITAGLPKSLEEGHGVVVSAGFDGELGDELRLFLSPQIREIVSCYSQSFVHASMQLNGLVNRDGVYTTTTSPASRLAVAAVRPWKNVHTRDLGLIPRLMQAAFDWASEQNVTHLHMPLIGGGASRHFPASVPLAMMIRAHQKWCAERARTLPLTIHLVDRSAIFELSSGRLNVDELLNARDVRLWIAIEPAAASDQRERVLHEPAFAPEGATLLDLAVMAQLPSPESWEAHVSPSATVGQARIRVSSSVTLAQLGAIPGATVTFCRTVA